jgi:hypothetical protein
VNTLLSGYLEGRFVHFGFEGSPLEVVAGNDLNNSSTFEGTFGACALTYGGILKDLVVGLKIS